MSTMKEQIETLERKNDKQARAIERQKKGITERQAIIDASSDWEKRWGEARSELSDVIRAKNAAIETISDLERSVSSLSQEVGNHETNLKDIQRDMRTVCEAVYGDDFKPEWTGDRPMNIWQNGQEYTLADPSTGRAVETVSCGYIEPIQRLMRMVWRRTHWGLNPLILRDNGINYQTPR